MNRATEGADKRGDEFAEYLNENAKDIPDKQLARLRDWFFTMGNLINDRLPKGIRYERADPK